MADLKLGLSTGYWSSGPPAGAAEAVLEADKLGFDSVWTAEAYGSDALTPLAWWGSQTQNIRLGTSIVQMSARTPAATAMSAMTMDHLSGGRFILGIGASGPQVVEGWYGQPYPRPLERTREYVQIVRDIVRREAPVEFHGKHYDLPYTGDDGLGIGKALKPTVHPFRPEIPIWLGAEGPKNVSLAAEIGDGWLPLFFSPKEDAWYRERLQVGFDASGEAGKAGRFEVASMLTVIPGDGAEECANLMRPFIALYAGGMGAKGANFHFDVFDRMGWGGVATEIQELYLQGKKNEAAALIPLEMVEDVALVGPPAKIKDEMAKWKETCLTTVLLSAPRRTARMLADLING
ncbi:MAG: LLM class F420-dependent oxidoreductase [Ilumatobacteraceae bacterium]